jgi:FKBP-type peptidyl-prolyl cis-trans isomerase
MGVTRTVISNGDGQNKPKKKGKVTVEYTGYLYDFNKKDNRYRGIK